MEQDKAQYELCCPIDQLTPAYVASLSLDEVTHGILGDPIALPDVPARFGR